MTSPTHRLHLTVSSLTILLMFIILNSLPSIEVWAKSNLIFKGIFSLASGIGIYKVMAKGIDFAMRKSITIKKLLLGAYYVEGTWVGYFIGHNKDKRYVVETFEQDLETLTIRGRSFTAEDNPHAQWVSETSTLDIPRGTLTYTYSCDILSQPATFQGVGVFQFERKTKSDPPTAIQGYVADLVDGQRLPVNQIKASSEIKEISEGLSIAKEKFKT